ncbi:hypothetical protein KI387_032788, partial [Taxus chinensis]
MGNSKFRLSHVMPNVWFYKLTYIGRYRESQKRREDIDRYREYSQKRRPAHSTYGTYRDDTAISFPRNSHHYGRRERVYNHRNSREEAARCRAQPEMVEIESMKQKMSKGKMKSKGGSSLSSTFRGSRIFAGCSCRATVDSVWESRETVRDEFSISDELDEQDHPVCPSRLNKTSYLFGIGKNVGSLDSTTRSRDFQYGIKEENQKESSEKKSVPARKKFNAGQTQLSVASVRNFNPHVARNLGNSRSQIDYKSRTRVLSPNPNGMNYNAKLRSKGTSDQKRSKVADKCHIVTSDKNSVKCGDSGASFTVVKSSFDPQKDFRESMVEMIKENNIRYHRDLQRLLRCYITLNPVKNHDIIVKDFEQIPWAQNCSSLD